MHQEQHTNVKFEIEIESENDKGPYVKMSWILSIHILTRGKGEAEVIPESRRDAQVIVPESVKCRPGSWKGRGSLSIVIEVEFSSVLLWGS